MAKTYVRSIKFSQSGETYWVRDAETKERVDALEPIVEGKADASSVYSKSETNELLNAKQATLVSGTNIKTINNESILGSGNITIQGGGTALPDQTGQSGKFLTTDGTDLSWGTPGGSGSSSYNDLTNKPSLNGTTIEGTLSSSDFGLLDSNQGAVNEGKVLGIDSTGTVIPIANSTSQPIYIGNTAPTDSFYQFWLDTSAAALYQRVEYVVAEGAQYFDLGFKPTNNISFYIDAAMNASAVSTQQAFMGSYVDSSSPRFAFRVGSSSCATLYGTSPEQTASITNLGTRRIYSLHDGSFYYGSTSIITPQPETFTVNNTVSLFANHSGDDYARQLTATIYEATVTDTNISFHLVPCYRLSDNVIGFYDTEGNICPQTNTPFWTSFGSAFVTKGPDVTNGLI